MQKADSIPSAGANADSSTKVEVSTSSSNDTKPNVVGSQCTPLSTEKLWAVNPEKGQPIDLSSQGLLFYLKDGSTVGVFTKDLIEILLKKRTDDEEKAASYQYTLTSNNPPNYFPADFFKDINDKLVQIAPYTPELRLVKSSTV